MNNTYFVLLYPDELILPEAVSVLLNEYGNEVEYSRIFEANLHEFGKLIHSKDAVLSLGKRSN